MTLNVFFNTVDWRIFVSIRALYQILNVNKLKLTKKYFITQKMGVIEKLFSSMSGIYNGINPATLSGSTDIIVVENDQGELHSTPFHARFNKLYLHTRTAHLIVNGVLTPVCMKVGNQGELYFEAEETEDQDIFFEDTEEINTEKYSVSDSELLIKTPTRAHISPKRILNIEKRLFGKKRLKPENHYETLSLQFKKFAQMLDSQSHYEVLLEENQTLLHILGGLIFPLKNYKNEECKDSYCKKAQIRFSLCFNASLKNRSVEDAFEACLVREVQKTDALIVQIKGCRNTIFYFKYSDFAELFFYVRGLFFDSTRNKSASLRSFLETQHDRRAGWSLWKNKTRRQRIANRTLRPTPAQLSSLNLKHGRNELIFKMGGADRQLSANIFLWRYDDKILVSDIDGTITKSDLWGHIYGYVGKDWTHLGVAQLFSRIARNGYQVLYLSSRPIGQSSITRAYLRSVIQNGYTLPEGPVMLSPDGIFTALYREIITRRPEDFKIACLKSIQDLFGGLNPFISGFGNKNTDVITYKALDIPLSKIFTINHKGEVHLEFSKELPNSYASLNSFVDAIFPVIKTHFNVRYNEINYWRAK
ncbi:Nuclear elongation and deformation protein 1 [Astathelohania contejeani]|uniref:Nuclear elongation and deformation protein 1 n=1 Tax=Astathelohania contejeani TaxID=164912 RepID=A0ABQ7HWA6_9MICR|nr:Nuclear elongation and deformation protein 1 [Thelohania contejeani]